MPEFVVRAADLGDGEKQYKYTLSPEWLREVLREHDLSDAGIPGDASVRASKSSTDIVIRGRVDATLTMPCSRCLEPAKVPVHSDLSLIFVPAKSSKLRVETTDDGIEFQDGDPDILPYDGEVVVLDDVFRDELVLEIPMIPLCSESCPGIAVGPGEEQVGPSIDPRLAPLMRFKPKS